MSRYIPFTSLLLCFALFIPSPAQAQMRETFSYQGYLLGPDGDPVTGTVDLAFALYDDATGGTALWQETHTAVPVADGIFTVHLGRETSFDGVVFDSPLWLGVQVDGGTELAPRVALAATPYALSVRGLRVESAADPSDGPNVIGGWSGNEVAAEVVGATIAGGGAREESGSPGLNEVAANYGSVGGGLRNLASGISATVSGGDGNGASGEWSTVGGGNNNTAGGAWSTIAGGRENTAAGSSNSTVGGGYNNTAGDFASTVSGGLSNTADGPQATVGGGRSNVAGGNSATVPGGFQNQARGDHSFAAGFLARAAHTGAFVWNDGAVSGDSLVSTADYQFLIRAASGVGIGTNAPTSPLTVAGVIESSQGGFQFPDGTVQTTAATSGTSTPGWQLGGNSGTSSSTDFIGTTDVMPLELRVNGARVLRLEVADTLWHGPNVIGGWRGNSVAEGIVGATIAGGGDPIDGINGGPRPNEVLAIYGTISGGSGNKVDSDFATVGGGEGNTASGNRSTVPGGFSNQARGAYSFAAGNHARAAHRGAFVWNDYGTLSDSLVSTAPDQFLIDARGGVGIGTNAPQAQLHLANTVNGTNLILGGSSNTANGDNGILASDPQYSGSDLILRSNDVVVVELDHDGSGEDADFEIWDKDGQVIFNVDESGEVSVRGTVVHSSDRNRKERIEAVDGGEILSLVSALPVYQWSYRGEAVRHVGPMAQDFYGAFGLGRDERTIAAVDADGVALAAIQALYRLAQAQRDQIAAQQSRMAMLETEVATLHTLVRHSAPSTHR